MALLRPFASAEFGITAAVASATFLVAYDEGGFSLSTRSIMAIATWWAVALGIGLAVFPRVRLRRPVWVVGALLAAFAAWTLASAWWASDAERPLVEFDRASLYLALFLLGATATRFSEIRRWAEGLVVGISATAVVALISRFFPSGFSSQGMPTFLPNAEARLSFPVGYWNGLAIFVAFGFPLCLGLSVRAMRTWSRCLALAPVPLFAAVIYLASSRGGVIAACAGAVVFLVLTERRWSACAALVAAAVGSAAAVAVVASREQLVHGDRTAEAAARGYAALVLLLAVAIATGALFALGSRALAGFRPGRTVARVLVAVVTLALLVGATASHPRDRLATFKQGPSAAAVSGSDGVGRVHLLSGSGTGRWQFWSAALDEWRSAPAIGRGAGSYESWWAAHASFTYFVRNAHSLYLEVLAELGIIGLLLLATPLVYGACAAIGSTLRVGDEERVTAASLVGVLFGFLLGAGIDWVWQLTALTAVGMVSLGLLTGPLAVSSSCDIARRAWRPTVRVAAIAVGVLLVVAQAIPWLSDLQLRASAAAVLRGDGGAAVRDAQQARRLQPWAASPYLQLALVYEQLGRLTAARDAIGAALDRSPLDWRLWLVSARLATEGGDVAAGRAGLLHAASLNPRSPLFARIALDKPRAGGRSGG
jgi:O-Antigen ligase